MDLTGCLRALVGLGIVVGFVLFAAAWALVKLIGWALG